MRERFEIPVRLFGRHRELAGESVVPVVLAAGGTVKDLRDVLAGHPILGGVLEGSAIAVNRRYEPDRTPVRDGDEIAVIPPVAGG